MKIACLGDSLTRGFGQDPTPWVDVFQGLIGTELYDVDNFGVDGAKLQAMLTTLNSSIIGQGYTHLVFLGGINNIAEVSPETGPQIFARLDAIVQAARASGLKVLVSTVWPWAGFINYGVNGQNLTDYVNTQIRAYNQSNVQVIDGYALFGKVGAPTFLPDAWTFDGLHINNLGAVFWGNKIDLALDLPPFYHEISVNRIQFRRGTTAGKPTVLSPGEPAWDYEAGSLYIGAADGTPTAVGGGGTGPQTFTSVNLTATSGNTALQGVTGALFKLGTGSQEYFDTSSNTIRVASAGPSGGLQCATYYGSTFRGIGVGEVVLQTFSNDGASACPFTFQTANNLTNAGAKLAKFLNNSSTEVFNIRPTGKIEFPQAGNSTGTPGAATINQAAGRSSIAAAASSVVITNSLVSTSSIVFAVLQTVDATATQILSCVPASGSFTIRTNAVATGTTNVGWVVIN